MVSTVVKTILMVLCLTEPTSGHCKRRGTEFATQISTLTNEMKAVEEKSKSLMAKVEGVDESFKTVEAKITVLNTHVSSLTQNMKAMEENYESLKALSMQVSESVNQLKYETGLLTTQMSTMEKTMLDEKSNSHDLVTKLRKRLLEIEEKQEDKIELSKDMFELPDTADHTHEDEHVTHFGNFKKKDFSSWERLTTKLVDGKAHQILLYFLLAVILSQVYLQLRKWINPTKDSQEDRKRYQSTEEIAKPTKKKMKRNIQFSSKCYEDLG